MVLGMSSLIQTTISAQELNVDRIDTSNYNDYNVFNERQKYLKCKKISEAFLKEDQVLLIIKVELEKRKINDMQHHVIYELNNNEHIVLDAYSPKKNIGSIYF
jgi:hypothetical protein